MLTLPTTPQTRAAPRAATLRRHALELGRWTHTLAWASESAAAFALLVLATPLILGLAAFVLLVDGRPAFYRGERLGRGKKPFTMIKIRTLRRGAERVTVDRLLESRDGLEIPGGRWLRESRLDELPQLWNVVCGDMRFIGPRPERRGVYLAHCRTLPRYAQRFAVAPGLIGPSQLFTPHATHKRIRCCLDNAWCRRRRSASELLGLTAYTVLAVVRKVGERAAETLGECWRTRLLARRPQQRRQRRVRPQGAYVTLGLSGGPGTGVHALLVDLSDETLRVQSGAAFAVGAQLSIRLTLCLGRELGSPLRVARLSAVVLARRVRGNRRELILRYRTSSPYSDYVLQQYFLGNSLARPHPLRALRRRFTPGLRTDVRGGTGYASRTRCPVGAATSR